VTELAEQEALQAGELEIVPEEARPVLARAFAESPIQADGRNLYLRCVPWDEPATVVDDPPNGDGIPYQESFARGSCAGAIKDPRRVYLEFEHFHPGLSGVIGRGDELEERPDALYGRFRVLNTQDGDKALELIADGTLQGASVFFKPQRAIRTAAGLVRRTRVKLERVAIAPEGSYPGAKILAVRTQDDGETPIVVPELERLPAFDPELVARLSAQGITLSDRLR
jgi:HK97 family phage prohead protease